MTVHHALIVEPDKLREWARRDDWSHGARYRARRERGLAQLGEWLGLPVGLITWTDDGTERGSDA